MFHTIPEAVLERMHDLETIDDQDGTNGTAPINRLKQIPPETGKFISILARSAPDGNYVEIGTSAGYSALWIGLACREIGRKLTTFEVLHEKAKMAEETFRVTNMLDTIRLINGDAVNCLADYRNISFCFLDADKEIYLDCYELLIPRMVRGGILIADNAVSHKAELNEMLDHALNDRRVDAVIVPIDSGELLCRKL
jgi:caffeoyl-CoA O-methyltransferase